MVTVPKKPKGLGKPSAAKVAADKNRQERRQAQVSNADATNLSLDVLNARYAKRQAEQRKADKLAHAAAAQQKLRNQAE